MNPKEFGPKRIRFLHIEHCAAAWAARQALSVAFVDEMGFKAPQNMNCNPFHQNPCLDPQQRDDDFEEFAKIENFDKKMKNDRKKNSQAKM